MGPSVCLVACGRAATAHMRSPTPGVLVARLSLHGRPYPAHHHIAIDITTIAAAIAIVIDGRASVAVVTPMVASIDITVLRTDGRA